MFNDVVYGYTSTIRIENQIPGFYLAYSCISIGPVKQIYFLA